MFLHTLRARAVRERYFPCREVRLCHEIKNEPDSGNSIYLRGRFINPFIILLYVFFISSLLLFSINFQFIKTTSFTTFIYVPFIPEDLDSITPALSNFRNALTITDLVIPTRSATLLATRIPSVRLTPSKYE